MTPWWKSSVIYQIYPRSFMDSNGDGIGDLQGIMQRLDYLVQLGVDALWLSPIFPSPMIDFGYDVSDYVGIHPDYGTMADFDQLLSEAHQRGLKLILDLVPNHTSDQHPWFIEARSSRDNPKRDWYLWHDPAPDGGLPNNWRSYVNTPAWTFDERTGQYYMHNFHSAQPELNWRNPAVQEAMHDVIRFWLKRGVDGFRIDVIDRLIKDREFRDNPANPKWKPGDGIDNATVRVYSELKNDELYALHRQIRAVFDEFTDRVMIGEVAYGTSPDELRLFYGSPTGDGQADGMHLPFNFNLILLPWRAESIRDYVATYERTLPEYAWPNYVLGNHDQPRISSRLGSEAQARLAMLLLLTLRGTPTIYYGDEIGMKNVPIPKDEIQDSEGKGGRFNRDECRAPMQWDASANTGFTTEGVKTWVRVNPDHTERNVAKQLTDPESILNLTTRLLACRRSSRALQLGSYEALSGMPEGCFGYLRRYDDERKVIILNFSSEEKTIRADQIADGKIVISTLTATPETASIPGGITLNPTEGVIIEL